MKKAVLAFVSFGLLFVFTACNNDEGQSGIVSGTLDEEYEGVVNPKLDVNYKLSDGEIEQGIVPLEMGLEIFIEERDEVEEDEEEGEGGKPKPNV